MDKFCHLLPKLELHAHLNGSLSRSTMLQLMRFHADAGIDDNTDAFFDEFLVGAGDTRNLSDCFQVFQIAHSLTSTPETLSLATQLTLEEFEQDGCCYIEIRSTPRETSSLTRKQYIETIIQEIINYSVHSTIIARLIISMDRRSSKLITDEIADLAIESCKKYPEVVVGVELSGDPGVGNFNDFVPALNKARAVGLKVTLHCGEICNTGEVLEMLHYKPDRIGHGTCIHPRFGGNEETWAALCESKIPVEVCLTSNVNTKSCTSYEDHHFKELYSANIPTILCTDDKGVFSTSLSHEYKLCAETFNLDKSQLAKISLNACQYIFAEDVKKTVTDKILNFIDKNAL